MAKQKSSEERLLTRAEVAEIFQVAPSTITRWAEAGKLPAVKTLGGHRRYEAEAVEAVAQEFMQINEKKMETAMEKTVISVPAMYGDHHVVEVRNMLFEMPGVEEVNASSCFHAVEVSYDPEKISPEALEAKLGKAGYLDELPVPEETAGASTQEAKRNGQGFFRHTIAFKQANQVIGFSQSVAYSGRPLWSCPGVGVINRSTLEE